MVLLVWVVLVLLIALQRNIGPDTWWHLKAGEYIVETGSIPTEDIFSYTASGRFWYLYAWLPEAVSFLVYSKFGFPGLILVKLLVVLSAFLILLKLMLENKINFSLALMVTLLAVFVSRKFFLLRPHIISYLFIVLILHFLELYYRKDRKWLWFCPLLFVIWVNCHVNYILGLAIMGIYFVTKFDRDKKTLNAGIIIFISSLACLINPMTYRLPGYLLSLYSTSGLISGTLGEWHSPMIEFDATLYDFLLILVPLVIVILLSLKRVNFTKVLLILFLGYLAVSSQRHIPYFALVCAYVLSEHLQYVIDKSKLMKKDIADFRFVRRFAVVFYVVLIVVLFAGVYKVSEKVVCYNPHRERDFLFPESMMEFIKINNLPGKIYNAYSYGGYIIKHLYPQKKVFIDGRANTVYPDDIYRQYLSVKYLKPGWEEILEKHQVNLLLLDDGTLIRKKMEKSDEWEKIFRDIVGALFIKKSPENKGIIDSVLELKYPDTAFGHFSKAFAYGKKGMLDEGIEELKKGISVDPEEPDLYNALGRFYDTKNEPGNAVIYYKKAVELEPERFLAARRNLAVAYERKGMVKEAIEQYEIIVKLEPESSIGLSAKNSLRRITPVPSR